MKNRKISYLFSSLVALMLVFTCFSVVGCGKTDSESNKVNFNDSNILVTYFSATGNTERVSGYIKDYLNADIFEITPEVEYTSTDLNYNNSSSRVSLERNAFINKDTSSLYYRPAFDKSLANLDNYDIIFIGYPIWWGEAPNIVYTFLEEYSENFANKIIIPLCTSASSGIGQSANNLHSSVSSSAIWLSGQRFSNGASSSAIESWLDNLAINK